MRHRLVRHRGLGKQRSDDARFASIVYFNMRQETSARGIHDSISSASHALYRKSSVHRLMLWRCAREAGGVVWQRSRASKQHACVLQSCATRRAPGISSVQCLRTRSPRRHRRRHRLFTKVVSAGSDATPLAARSILTGFCAHVVANGSAAHHS